MGWKRRRVLVVDDDQLAHEAIRIVLERKGHLVKCVSTLPHAEDLIRAGKTNKLHQFDLILLDLNFGEQSGTDLLRRMRDDRSFDIPVLIISGAFGGDELLELTRLKIAGFLVKPFGAAKMAQAVEEILFPRRRGAA